MSTQLSGSTGCGSAGCQCVGTPVDKLIAINGIALDDSHQAVDRDSIHEMAYGELLRQHAVEQGLLPRILGLTAPELTADMRDVIQDMLDNGNSLRNNEYLIEGKIDERFFRDNNPSSIVTVRVKSSSGEEIVFVKIPANFNNMNIEREQRYAFKVKFEQGGIPVATKISRL